jgi:hypothetical protein
MKKNEPFVEKYLLPMADVSDADEEGGWKYTTLESKGHPVTLTQEADICEDDKIGTLNIIKDKTVFNFKLHFAILLKDKGKAGIVFRYSTEFDFYYLSISSGSGFEIGRFTKGVRKVLLSKKIDMPHIDTWYRVWIKME